MKKGKTISWLPATTALLLIAVAYFLSQPPKLTTSQAEAISSRFQFERLALPKISEKSPQSVRKVHPDLQHLAPWISFVGAAVSLGDLDGDGLPNDLVFVDTRYDEITVCPVPGQGDRFRPFVLRSDSLKFDDATTAPMGTLIGDFNEDGRADILAYFWGRSPIIFLQNELTPTSNSISLCSFSVQELVEPAEVWHTCAISQADMDGDGQFDLVVGNYNPDGAETLNPNSNEREGLIANWARATNGGTNRLFLATKNSPADGDLFTEATGVFDESIARGWTFAVGLADLDGDMLPEIYFVQDFGPDCLLHNRSTPGHPKFEPLRGKRTLMTPRSKVLGLDTFNGMGIEFGDLNEDGHLDMMVSNITSDYGLHESSFVFMNTGQLSEMTDISVAPFHDQSEKMGLSRGGWAWDIKFADFDNDSTLEVMQTNGFIKGDGANRWPEMHEVALGSEELARFPLIYPLLREGDDVSGHEINRFYVKQGERYYDIEPHLKSSNLDEPMLSRGIATADVDGDGNLDFALANNWEDSYFFLNQSKNENQFLGLHLRLKLQTEASETAGKIHVKLGHPEKGEKLLPAIGAQVIVRFGQDGQQRRLIGQVDGGNGHTGRRAPDLHFGLGELPLDEKIELEIKWRDRNGKIQQETISDLTPGWHTILLHSSEAIR